MALPIRVSRTQQAADPMELMRRDFDTVVNRLFGGLRPWEGESTLAPFGVDIREDADHIYIEADLPGFKKEDIDISLENQMLTITAEKREGEQQPSGQKQQQGQQQQRQGDYLLRERRYERFTRSFTLPTTIDEGQVNAKLQDGILTITLNKREEAKPHRIQVS